MNSGFSALFVFELRNRRTSKTRSARTARPRDNYKRTWWMAFSDTHSDNMCMSLLKEAIFLISTMKRLITYCSPRVY